MLSRSFRKDVVNYSLSLSIIGGTIVNLVNQGELIFHGEEISLLKMVFT